MSIDRRNRIAFEEVADLYNEVRPGYPEALVEDVLALSRLPPGGRILEIGCGPGNATVPFARRGFRIVAIELGERLAALAAANCRPYPEVEILHSSFEDWPLEQSGFDLAISADAFHWITPEVGYPKLAAALRDTGSAALFWNVSIDPAAGWSRAVDEVYRSLTPGLQNPDNADSVEWLVGVIRENLAACGCFSGPVVRQYHQSLTLTGVQYIKLLRTFSGHRALEEAARQELYARILKVIEQFGGQVTKSYVTVLFHARVKR